MRKQRISRHLLLGRIYTKSSFFAMRSPYGNIKTYILTNGNLLELAYKSTEILEVLAKEPRPTEARTMNEGHSHLVYSVFNDLLKKYC